MALDLSLPNLLNPLSGLLLVALGGFVLVLRPRLPSNARLGGFLVAFGSAYVCFNVPRLFGLGDAGEAWGLALGGAAWLVAAGLLASLALRFPLRVGRADRPAVAAATAVGVALAVFALYRGFATMTSALASELASAAGNVLHGVAAFALTLFALRWARVPVAERGRLALMSIALSLYLGWDIGLFPVGSLGVFRWTHAGVLLMVGLSLLWLRNAAVGEPRRLARNAALAAVAAVLFPMVVRALAPGEIRAGFGVVRLAAAAVLAYAILRHQLLEIDVRLRWTLSRGTVTAAFLAVFLIVSQVAENYLDQLGVIVGGVSAAVLLLALSPLQRAAERVAERAIPLEQPGPATDRKAEAYKAALRLALRDGTVSRDAERGLATLAAELGLDPARAFALREEVEAHALNG